MLRHRITRLVVAMTAAVVVAFVLPLGALVKVMAEDQAVAGAKDRANNIATVVAGVGDERRLRGVLEPLLLQPSIHTCVSLSSGQVVGETEDSDDAERVVPLINQARSESRSMTERHDDGADVMVPVLLPTGTVVVHSAVHFAAVRDGVMQAWLFLAGLTIVLIGLSVVVARAIAVRIATPVTNMAGVAHQLREGDLDARADTSGPHEIAGLGVALNRLAERISELLASEREAAADLSHRLRTPVTALRLDTDLITDEVVQTRLRNHVDEIHRAIDAVVAEARRTSRDAMGSHCDVMAVVAERGAFWQPLAEDQGRTLTVALGADQDRAHVPLSRHDLTDIVDNLVDNVFAHTPEGAPMRISARRSDRVVTLTVEDGGPGLGVNPRIVRGRSGSGSTGLGLDIVSRVTEAAHGTLTLGRSTLGGLAVTVTLPLLDLT
ncbi:MAG: HAMP domain-containing histidine kinase [Dermatophilaceae bacterium]|nr:HAMP domain-containing histidine kinase [Dermatophilaceae bacterium]MBP9919839.1 HAMP domain-containing histidine kinase [Dermatophilaceae bacterium]